MAMICVMQLLLNLQDFIFEPTSFKSAFSRQKEDKKCALSFSDIVTCMVLNAVCGAS